MSVAVDIPLQSPPAAPVLGFGDYSLPDGKSFDQMQCAAKTCRVAMMILFGILAVAAIALAQISMPLAIVTSVGFSTLMIKTIVSIIGVGNRAPPMNALFPAEKLAQLPPLGELAAIPCSGFPTKDGPDSQYWKEELIRAARKSILLSGCYCGGRAFERTLHLLVEQMRTYPELQVQILASDVMFTPENQVQADAIQKEFPTQFTCLKTPEIIPFVSPVNNAFTMSTNHTKALVIDYGRFFIVGGSGIVSSWSEQEGLIEPVTFEKKTGCMSVTMDLFFKIKAFRDMDFVFRSELNGAGTRLYVEMAKLFERLRYRQSGEMVVPVSNWEEQLASLESSCEPFERHPLKAEGMQVACYASGPEQIENDFLAEFIRQVDAATTSIVVNNLYFQPPKKLFDAFVNASNRGVKIDIVTNKNGSQSPGSHALYTERSRYFARKLFEGRVKPNVKLHEYDVAYSTLHKKVAVFDGKTTLCGTSNIGNRSLDNVDYEINLKIESAEFAAATTASIEADMAICTPIPDDEAPRIPFGMHVVGGHLQKISMIFA